MSLLQSLADWTTPQCQGCGERIFRGSSFDQKLRDNFNALGQSDPFVTSVEFLCEVCFRKRELARCDKTGIIFPKHLDKSHEYRGSQIYRNLSPCHPSSKLFGPLSEQGLSIIGQEHEEMQDRLRRWAGGTRFEHLQGYRIIRDLGVVQGSNESIGTIVDLLKWHTVQIGGNGYIRYFWDKQICPHQEEYIAGYGVRGNPYYRTRRWNTVLYNAHAIGVVAEPLNQRPANRSSGNGGNWGNGGDGGNPHGPSNPNCPGPTGTPEQRYASILGLKGQTTTAEIKHAYRVAMLDYHPDRVTHLGADLRRLAEQRAKEINEAYAYFKTKYRF